MKHSQPPTVLRIDAGDCPSRLYQLVEVHIRF